MTMRFQILGSSSNGNCALIETGEARVLIDAGFSGKRICQMLGDCGLSIEDINAVFLTHEHSDHIAGVRGLARHDHLEFYANYATAQAVQSSLKRQLKWKLFESGTRFQFRDLRVETVRVPHDAYDPVGYVIRSGDGTLFSPEQSVAWLTDLGYVPDGVERLVRDVSILVLEANHDLQMLEACMNRPFSVKQRIRGRHGHLSNDAALQFLQAVDRPMWRRVYLAHLSRDCNCPIKVGEVFGNGSSPWPIHVVHPDAGPTDRCELMAL